MAILKRLERCRLNQKKNKWHLSILKRLDTFAKNHFGLCRWRASLRRPWQQRNPELYYIRVQNPLVWSIRLATDSRAWFNERIYWSRLPTILSTNQQQICCKSSLGWIRVLDLSWNLSLGRLFKSWLIDYSMDRKGRNVVYKQIHLSSWLQLGIHSKLELSVSPSPWQSLCLPGGRSNTSSTSTTVT